MTDKREQAEISASTLGKFNTAQDLLAAYNALESEFTKRCQLLKQLQARLDEQSAQAEEESETSETLADELDMPIADSVAPVEECVAVVEAKPSETAACETSEEAADPQNPTERGENIEAEITAARVLDEVARNAVCYAEALSAIPEVMAACIASYKQKLLDGGRYCASPGGMAVIIPAKRPRTLAEAKLLADKMLAE